MASQPLVAILLSTHNGERFIAAQLDSLLRQTHGRIRILVRDDGSSDATAAILSEYSMQNPNVHVALGDNVGAPASFLELINLSPLDADYFAFSDQDDVWKEDKVARSVGLLEQAGTDSPAMCFTSVEIVNAKLDTVKIDDRRLPRGASFENAIVQNVVSGCTLMFNAPACKALRGRRIRASEVCMHDWWVYQVIAGLGKVIYDSYPSVKYRQHGGNLVGAAIGLKPWFSRIKRHTGTSSHQVRRQARELLRVYGEELVREKRAVLEEFVLCMEANNPLQRAKYAFSTSAYRQLKLDDLILKALMIAGRV